MIKLSDYLIKFLVQKGIRDIFMISGGGIIHLVDSLGKNKDMNYFCNYNEQAASYCAEGYARLTNSISACLVTTGPGSTNALSGVASAWMDSVPMIVISGQVKRELIADYQKLRQIGEQEVNIIDIVKPITKYAVTLNEPSRVRYELERAFHLAGKGRPGPVWINIPLDVQGSFIKEEELKSFSPAGDKVTPNRRGLSKQVQKVVKMLKAAKRPIILGGYGIRLGGAENLLQEFIEKNNLPFICSFNGMDLISEQYPLFVGKVGIIGQRRANFAVQNSDCLLSIGSRLNIKIVGYNYKGFAPKAKKIAVDIDEQEMRKKTVFIDLIIPADSKEFLEELLEQLKREPIKADQQWLDACQDWRRRYPPVPVANDSFKDKNQVTTYAFYDKLSDKTNEGDVVISGNGLAAVCLYQAYKVKKNQRVFTNNGYGAMGWGLPASIGACIANDSKRTICITGDGSIQMNIQELQLIKHYNLPLKVFIFNNSGYTSIRLTQDTFFNGYYVGADKDSGVSNPNFKIVAESYGLGFEQISTDDELESKIVKVLEARGAVICEVILPQEQGIAPKTVSYKRGDGSFESKPLEDMYPFLSRKELEENMSISKE